MGAFGETLRQARLDKGVSLADAEHDTRIRRRYLEALENEDFAALPAPVYARGMIRAYGRYLGLPPEGMVDLFQSARPREERVVIRSAASHTPSAPQISIRSVGIIGGAVGTVVLLVLVWGQYSSLVESMERVQARQAERTAIAGPSPTTAQVRTPTPVLLAVGQATATPTRPATATPVPTPIDGVLIEARLVSATWMEVWQDGDKVLGEMVPAGAVRRFEAKRTVRMRVANGAALQIAENGLSRGVLDAGGRAVDARWTRG